MTAYFHVSNIPPKICVCAKSRHIHTDENIEEKINYKNISLRRCCKDENEQTQNENPFGLQDKMTFNSDSKSTLNIPLNMHAKFFVDIIKEKCTYIIKIQNITIAHFTITEKIKETALETISQILNTNKQVMILSGDTKSAIEQVAKNLGIHKYEHSHTSISKLEKIQYLQRNHRVMMVGDGINDMLSVKKSDIGVSISNMHENFSNQLDEISDVTVFNNNLSSVYLILKYMKIARFHVRLCYAFSFLYNMCMIVSVSFGPIFGYQCQVESACAFMFLSSCLVIFNSLIILLYDSNQTKRFKKITKKAV